MSPLLAAEKRLFTNGRRRFSLDTNRLRLEIGEEIETQNDISSEKFYLPRGLEWKSNALGFLSRDLINRAVFVDSALRSIRDGLLIADREGQIVFTNRSALRIFNLPERKLLGKNIFEQIFEAENKIADSQKDAEELFAQLTIDRNSNESEITVEKFYRAPRRSEAEVAGTGLGLALAQKIAEPHGGRISAESEPGKGSTFTIYLPLETENLEKNRAS